MKRTFLAIAFTSAIIATAAVAPTVQSADDGERGSGASHKSSGLGVGGRYAYVNNNSTDEVTHMGGVMARLRGSAMAIEGAVDYRNEDLAGDIDLKSWPITASLLVYPLPMLYGLAGVGWYKTTLDFPSELNIDDQTSDDFGYHVGAGFEAPLAPAVSLTGDVRWQFIDHEFSEIPDAIGEVDSDAWTINAGLLFYLR
ncbi:MAG: outer membrane protein [bacterium]